MGKIGGAQIISFILLIWVSAANAQDYVLTARGDSLTGEVKPLLYGPEKRIQLVTSGKVKTNFSIFEVRAFSSDGELYHPVKGEKGYYEFMKLVKPGYLSLYAYQMEDQTRFDGLFLQKMDGDGISVPNLGFKKFMSRFLEDCPAVAEQIQSGTLGKRDLHGIVDAYNACVESRTVQHNKILVAREESTTKINEWSALEEKVKAQNFDEKNDALEMITEIQKKVQRQEPIPNFLLEGLKNALRDTGLSTDLDRALDQLN